METHEANFDMTDQSFPNPNRAPWAVHIRATWELAVNATFSPSPYLLNQMLRGGASKLCIFISPPGDPGAQIGELLPDQTLMLKKK